MQSKDYLAKVIPKIFPSCNRTRVFRNGTSYIGFTGLKQCDDTNVPTESVTVYDCGQGDVVFSIPSLFQRDDKQVHIVTSVKECINMALSVGTGVEQIDLNIIDVTSRITVDKPAKAMVQISKSLLVCRGMETKEDTGERWTSLTQKDVQLRVRSPACQRVVPWLSSVDVCGACRTLAKKQSKSQDCVDKSEGASRPTTAS